MGIASLIGVALSASGEFDVSFGNRGLARLDIVPNATPGTGNDTANAMAVQPDDKIVAVGGSYNGHKGVFALIRHTRDGPLDPGFIQRDSIQRDSEINLYDVFLADHLSKKGRKKGRAKKGRPVRKKGTDQIRWTDKN